MTRSKSMIQKIMLSLFVGTLGFAAHAGSCPQLDEKNFSEIRETADACVAVRKSAHPKATSLGGDLLWYKRGSWVRVGNVPKDFVVLKDGILGVYFTSGSKMAIRYWDSNAPSQTQRTCADNLDVRESIQGNLEVRAIQGLGIQVRKGATVKTYFADCQDSGKSKVYADLTEGDRRILEKYSPYGGEKSNDLTHPTTVETLPEIQGRDDLVDKIISRLKGDNKRSTLLWGPAGVGKTAIAYRLATRIHRGEVPEWLKGWSVYVIDLGSLNSEGLAGVADGKMSEVVKAASGKKVVLLMDEIHQLASIGTAKDDTTDVTEVMKTNLANGELALIGTTTDDPKEKGILATKKAFFSRFSKIYVDEPNDEVLGIIYNYMIRKTQKRNLVHFEEGFIKELIKLTRQYVANEHHPRIGITFIELLGVEKDPRDKNPGATSPVRVTIDDLKKAIGEYANVTTLQSSKDEAGNNITFVDRVISFKENVGKKFIGQKNAIDAVERVLYDVAAQTNKQSRPAGIFLFIGPSGVGKTYLSKLITDMFGMKYKLFAMSQYTDDADVNTLFGSPNGYVGFNEAGGQLVQWVNNNPASSIIFDEIDKANTRVLEALMNLMEEGVVQGKGGAEAKFNNGFIFYTSNFAMDLVDAYDVCVRKTPYRNGEFDPKKIDCKDVPTNQDQLKETVLNALINDGKIGTYIAGRINKDNIVIFHHLLPEEAKGIAKLEVKKVSKLYREAKEVKVDQDVIEFIADKGLDFRFGARGMRNLAESLVKSPVNRYLVRLRAQRKLPVNYRIHVKMNAAKSGTVVRFQNTDTGAWL